jgi:hypothetical protein
MQENCWYKLNIDCSDAIQSDWKLPDTEGKDFGVWTEKAVNMFNQKWLKQMYQKGIYVADSLIFYRDAGHNTYNAHIDMHREHPKKISTFGLNMVFGGEDSIMTWYKIPKDNGLPAPFPGNPIYYNWPINQLEEIDRHTLGPGLTLTRIGIPHTVIMGDKPRWCISARAALIEQMYWKDVVKYMRDKNVLIERDDVQKN